MKQDGMVVNTEGEARKLLQRLENHNGNFGIDVETSGLNPRRNFIVAYVLSFGPHPLDSVYVPVRHGGGGNLPGLAIPTEAEMPKRDNHWFEIELSRIARYKQWNVIGHNLMFDLLFCASHNVVFDNSTYSCTQVRQAMVDEFTPSFSLDSSSRHMNVTEKKGDGVYKRIAELMGCEATRKEAMPHYWRLAGNDPIAVDYACGDGVSTWELYDAQEESIGRQELGKCWALEKRTTRTLFAMQRRGIPIDMEYMGGMRDTLLAKCEAMREPFRKFVNKDGVFSERSADCVEQVYRSFGYKDEDFKKTPTGRFSFTEDWMETNDVGKQLIEIRQHANLDNSFIAPAMERHIVGGRMYPNYNQLLGDDFGTVSGRLSSNNPNIQQVPKHNEMLAKLLRTAFIPDEGHLWSSNDYSQCEPRIFAEYTESKYLVDGYMQSPPVDLYNALSAITGASRQTCKRLALAIFYGAGKDKAAFLIGCSVEEAIGYKKQVMSMIPEIQDFIRSAEGNIKIRYSKHGVGFVKDIVGRRLRFRDLRYAYKGSNRIVQASNASLIKHGINEMHEYLESTGKGSVLLTCHDSIEAQFEEGATHINEEAMRVMVGAAASEMIPLKIPQKVDNGVGRNWGHATFGEAA